MSARSHSVESSLIKPCSILLRKRINAPAKGSLAVEGRTCTDHSGDHSHSLSEFNELPRAGTPTHVPYCRFGVRLLFSPIGGEATGAGGSEDGLTKAFEDDGNLRQPLLAGVHFAQQCFQPCYNPALFGERSKGNLSLPKDPMIKMWNTSAAGIGLTWSN